MPQVRYWTRKWMTLILFGLCGLYATVVRLSAEDTPKKTAPKKAAPVEPKLVIYDDEDFKGRSIIIRKQVQDLKALKFDNRSESIEWELPPTKAWVIFDDKNYHLPILVLIGKGAIKDIGKEKRNALHSISSVNLLSCGKGKRPAGISKDVEIVGQYEDSNAEETNDDAPAEPMKDENPKSEQPRTAQENPNAEKPKEGNSGKNKPASQVPPSAITQKNLDAMERNLGGIPKAEKMDLTPAKEWKQRIDNGGVVERGWRDWFLSAKPGDFVEYQNGDNSWRRWEVVSIENGVVTIAHVFQISTQKDEQRRGYKKLSQKQLDDQIKNTVGSKSDWHPKPGKEKLTVGDRELTCQIETYEVKDLSGKKTGKLLKRLSCDEVPFDGIVMEESENGGPMLLLNYGRGK